MRVNLCYINLDYFFNQSSSIPKSLLYSITHFLTSLKNIFISLLFLILSGIHLLDTTLKSVEHKERRSDQQNLPLTYV